MLEHARARDARAPRRRQAGAAVRPAHSGQGQRQHARLPDHRRHSGAAHFSPPGRCAGGRGAEGGGRASCSARPICTSSPTAGPATTSPSAPCAIPTIRPAFPAAAAAEPRLRSPPGSLLSGSPRIPKARFACPRRSAASQGFRPTTGRYSTQGCVPISPLFDQVGPHARSVADLALFDSVVTRERRPLAAGSLRGVRLGIVRDYWFAGLDPEVERITDGRFAPARGRGRSPRRGAAARRRPAGRSRDGSNAESRCTLRPRPLPQATYGRRCDLRTTHRAREPGHPGGVPAATSCRAARISSARPSTPRRAIATCPSSSAAYQDYFARTGCRRRWSFPRRVWRRRASARRPTLDIGGRAVPFEDAVARNIAPGSTAGVPGLVLPAGLTAARPAGGARVRCARGRRSGAARARSGARRALGTIAAPHFK